MTECSMSTSNIVGDLYIAAVKPRLGAVVSYCRQGSTACWAYLQAHVAANTSDDEDVWLVAVGHCALGDLHKHSKYGLLHSSSNMRR